MSRTTSMSPNWSKCIWEIERKTGMSQRTIAKKVGTSPSTVNKLKNQHNYTPSWPIGDAILMCLGEIEE